MSAVEDNQEHNLREFLETCKEPACIKCDEFYEKLPHNDFEHDFEDQTGSYWWVNPCWKELKSNTLVKSKIVELPKDEVLEVTEVYEVLAMKIRPTISIKIRKNKRKLKRL